MDDDYDLPDIDEADDYDEAEVDEEDLEEETALDESRTFVPINVKELQGNERRGYPTLNKFEQVSMISQRAIQLSKGDPSVLDFDYLINNRITDPIQIANEEFRQRVIPIYIERKWSDGSYEKWYIHEIKYFPR